MTLPATRQMQAREAILKSWLRDGIPWNTTDDGELIRDSDGEISLVYFPKDTKALAEWTGTEYGAALADTKFEFEKDSFLLSDLKKVSRSTQDKAYHVTTRNICLLLIDKLKEKAQFQLAETNKSNNIAKLMQRLSHLESINSIQEEEIRELRMQVRHLNSEIKRDERRYKNNEEQLRRDFEAVVEDNINLTKSLNKVSPLKTVQRKK
ncbi:MULTISPECIES: hypothetical protein [unclassified Herbaspirillum]|uniref:hypothetical protein n=1 Tax=unclassified Herbaspirillum TaxID=2624150 RepID=UPI00114F376E|nr:MULTISPECIES: hypothetical protein [unclassified Herbaspirillum]MBB5392781.1 putative coiled-coil protein SlyX [Herbaspirillum sp. SJZ102]TQK04571.1 hypothetical protein FB599_3135 [Herbaspirillum sp. SJZ130]TQK09643.1 hypothetical protein FB598_2626 [Herbaspirillum sp. SJZ106]